MLLSGWPAAWAGGAVEPAAAQAEELRLSRFPKSANQLIASQILQEVYRRCGLAAWIEPLPPSRAPIEALAGRLDGEVSRLRRHQDDYPALVRVTPAFDYFVMTAFSKRRIAVASREDLRRYRVGAIRGVQVVNDLVAGLEGVERAANSESLFMMLAADRFDIAVDVDINGAVQIHRLRQSGIQPVGVLLQAEVFHYLAPHRAYLQARLSEVISDMRRSGELERLKRRFSQQFIELGLEAD